MDSGRSRGFAFENCLTLQFCFAVFWRIDFSRCVEDATVGGSHRRFGGLFRGFGGSAHRQRRASYLVEIMVIALCTVLCGGQYASDMELFAREKEAFLRQFLKLEKGLPSHDTFSRVFRLLDPEQFSTCFQRFTSKFSQACQGVVAIDGKVLRRSFDKASGKSPLHMVSA